MIDIKKEALIIALLLVIPIVLAIDSDRDGISDDKDQYPYDFDNDGMPDAWEIRNGLRYDINDAMLDNDGDGLTNLEEYTYGTDSNSADSEGDKITDYEEIKVLGTNPLKKERILWPFVVFPVLIILFVLYLFLSHQYHIDIFIKQYYNKYFTKKAAKTEQPIRYVRQEKPKISYINMAQIKREMQENKKEKEKMMEAFGIKSEPKKQNIVQPIRKNILYKPKQIPKSLEILKQISKNDNKKDVFETKKKLNLFSSTQKPLVSDTKKKPEAFSSAQKSSIFDKLRKIR